MIDALVREDLGMWILKPAMLGRCCASLNGLRVQFELRPCILKFRGKAHFGQDFESVGILESKDAVLS